MKLIGLDSNAARDSLSVCLRGPELPGHASFIVNNVARGLRLRGFFKRLWDLISCQTEWSKKKAWPHTEARQIVKTLVCYGLGMSGRAATPLLGRGISGRAATPLLGRGISGRAATPLFGLGMSGRAATPLLFRDIARLLDATAMSIITRALNRFALRVIVVAFRIGGVGFLFENLRLSLALGFGLPSESLANWILGRGCVEL